MTSGARRRRNGETAQQGGQICEFPNLRIHQHLKFARRRSRETRGDAARGGRSNGGGAKRASARKCGTGERGRIFGDSAEGTKAGYGRPAEERVPGRAYSAGEEAADAEA